MGEHLVWHGYLLSHHEDVTVIQSPFTLNGARVFGADSDPTTLAVAACASAAARWSGTARP